MAKASPVEYLRQVKAEIKKISWPTKQETTISTVAVFIMVVFAAIFLFVADQAMAFGVKLILNLGM